MKPIRLSRLMSCHLATAISFTSQTIRNVNLELDVTEEHGQGHRKVSFCTQGDVPVAGLKTVQGQDSLAEEFAAFIIHAEAKHSQVRKDDLSVRALGKFCSLSTQLWIVLTLRKRKGSSL